MIVLEPSFQTIHLLPGTVSNAFHGMAPRVSGGWRPPHAIKATRKSMHTQGHVLIVQKGVGHVKVALLTEGHSFPCFRCVRAVLSCAP